MMTNKGDNERRIQCPYDKSHQILHYRFQTHLVKCKRNFPNVKMIDCMYNSVHRIPEPEAAYHYEHCPDRIRLDKFVYIPETVDTNKFPVPVLGLQPEEDWDDHHVATYDPEEYCKNNQVLRNVHTLSAAQRRNFRLEERHRMQQFNEGTSKKEESEDNQNTERQSERSVQRRPTAPSAALQRNDKNDISAMLEKVKLGANKATAPKLGRSSLNQNNPSSSKSCEDTIENEDSDSEYPPLGGSHAKGHTTGSVEENSWATITSRTMAGVAASANKPITYGRGRGSTFAQGKK